MNGFGKKGLLPDASKVALRAHTRETFIEKEEDEDESMSSSDDDSSSSDGNDSDQAIEVDENL